jgi:transposase
VSSLSGEQLIVLLQQQSTLLDQQHHLVHQQHQTIDSLKQQVDGLKHQIEWFKRQIFGSKSERFAAEPDPSQLPLAAATTSTDAVAAPPRQTVITHTRRVRTRDPINDAESLPFFEEGRLPIRTIEVLEPEIAALASDQYEVIDTKTSYRLAQRPGSYEILKYVRPVVKRKDTQQLSCALAPVGVIDGSRADVSFVAGLLVDKFAYHLPLYRQHLRLTDCGVNVSRPWLTQLSQKSISLLEPIYQAQLDSIRDSHVIALDETPIKAGRNGKGKMKMEYFWPIYGEQDEVCFPFFTSRATPTASTVLLTDGYAVYQRYAKQTGLTHAQCWAHARRTLYEAQDIEPQLVAEALSQIQALYVVEQHIRDHKLAGETKRLHRLTYSKPIVECFFAWINRQFQRQGLLPSNPFTQALEYVRARRLGLEVFLTDPDVPIDTNHLERALRAIPMGRKSWNFCWTELGAKHVGIVQSLIVTCRLHGIDPYTYLVDVLQRVAIQPAARVSELTPRLWKQHFASDPLRSDLHLFCS